MTSRVKRTYSARNRTTLSSPVSSSPPRPTTLLKRPLLDQLNLPDAPRSKKPRLSKPPPAKSNSKSKSLIQLHFSIDASILKTCHICDLSYTKGAPDDEALHKAHCSRVQRGMEWGKEEQKECTKANVSDVSTGITLKNGTHGRIVSFPANVGGKIGAKVMFSPLDTHTTQSNAENVPPGLASSPSFWRPSTSR
jgi:N-acetyltransferase